MSPVGEFPHHIEDRAGTEAREADVDAWFDFSDHTARAEKMEIEVKQVEADKEISLRVKIRDELPEGAEESLLVEMKLLRLAISADYPAAGDDAVLLDDDAKAQQSSVLRVQSKAAKLLLRTLRVFLQDQRVVPAWRDRLGIQKHAFRHEDTLRPEMSDSPVRLSMFYVRHDVAPLHFKGRA